MIRNVLQIASGLFNFILRLRLIVCTAAAVSLAACGPEESVTLEPTQQGAIADYQVTLKPTLSETGEVDAIEVTARLNKGLAQGEDRLKLMVPITYVMVTGIAERTLNLTVTDAEGDIPLSYEDGEPVPGGFPYFRTLTAEREVSFPVMISYRSLVQPAYGPNGPAFGIRPSRGGVSGSGAGFMLYPSNTMAETSVLDWDLSAFAGEETIGVTTYGAGRVEVDRSPAQLVQAWLMAGATERFPTGDEDSKFNGYWLGDFPYNVEAELEFTEHMYEFLGGFFTHLDPAPRYTVFLRQLDTQPFGGATALYNSFMLSRGPAREEEFGQPGPRQTFVHEMLHQWVGFIAEDHGNATWFNEGLTTYYEYTLPFRAGEISFEEFVEGLNELSERYFANPGRSMTADQIVNIGFDDGDIRHVPYVRGAFYFADLDARIRAASNGERTFDDLMERVFRERENGTLVLTIESWAVEAAKETGADELSRVREINIDGAFFLPSVNAFGGCVVGEETNETRGDRTFESMVWLPVPKASPNDCYERSVAN